MAPDRPRPTTPPALDVVLGLFADGPAWPEHGGDGEAALGAPVVGPAGLLDLVEMRLGLAAPAVPVVERLAAWQAKLEAATTPERFWARSLAVDAWATARLLLDWRDRLADVGWDAGALYAEARLRDLAAAERVDAELPPGPSDRAARAARVVASDGLRGIGRVRLIDPRSHFPAGTRRLLDALEASGVAVDAAPAPPLACGDTALGRLQRWLDEGGELEGPGDASVVVADAGGELLAAEALAQLLPVLEDEAGGGRVAVIAQGGDTHVLDAALVLAGQPRAGLGVPSPFRGALQLLPLAFQTAWTPLDVQALLDLILASPGPLAGFAQARLADALARAPSIRSPAWREAWTAIEERLLGAATTPSETRAARARLERWRAWAEPQGADPESGMPLPDALAICDRVAAWAIARLQLTHDPLYGATARVATDARRALLRLGRERLPRALVERVVDQALHQGDADPAAVAEAARRATLAHPGALWGPVETVVWWNLRDTGERADRAPWTRSERAELARFGAPVDPDTRSAAALAAAWERAVRHARRRLVLVDAHAAHADGAPHPFLQRIAAAERLATHVDLADALRGATWRVGPLALPRRAVARTPAPAPRPAWRTPEGFVERSRDRAESATTLERLVACQLAWVLADVAYVRPGRARAIADVHVVSGNLAHALSAAIFVEGPPPAPAAAEGRARELLEAAIDEVAAPLRQPEHAADLARVRRRLPQAMGALARALADNHLRVAGTERRVAFAPTDGPAEVRGFVDLLAHDASGAAVVVDLKWTRSRRHRDDLAAGRAVQLATYVAALQAADAQGAAPATPPRAGYFRLIQQEFATLRADGLRGMPVDGPPLLATWRDVTDAWRAWTRCAADGALLATGVPGWAEQAPDGLEPLREPPCEYCAFHGLCFTGVDA